MYKMSVMTITLQK